MEYNRLNNFGIGLLTSYLDIYDAIVKALIDHVPKTSKKRMTSQLAVVSKEGRVDEYIV